MSKFAQNVQGETHFAASSEWKYRNIVISTISIRFAGEIYGN